MEIREMQIEDIEARTAEIKEEMKAEDANLEELKNEVHELNERKAEIVKQAEERQSILQTITEGEGTVMNPINEVKEARTFGAETAEYREAYLKNLMGKELSVEERTAITASSVIPTETMNKIIGVLEKNPIIAAVDLTYIPGNVTYPTESTINAASWVDMGTAATDSTDSYSSISLAAYKLIKTVEVTADVEKMSIPAFENWLVERLANKLEKAVDAGILVGDGSSKATGILTTKSSAEGEFTKLGMTWSDVAKIVAELPTEYLGNASFVMPRAVFFKDVIGMKDSQNNRVIVADAQSPARFNILGFPVIVDDNLTADNVLFGDLKAYKFNFAQAPEVKSDDSVAFRTGSRVYRAMALCDGKLGDASAIVRFTRATA